VVLKKDVDERLERGCEKLRIFTYSQGRKARPGYGKTQE
jgi:hypothetical protein